MKNNRLILIISIITFSILFGTTVGYALYGARMVGTGSVTFKAPGEIAITDVTLSGHNHLNNPSNPEFTADSVVFDLEFEVENNNALQDEFYAEYAVTITNDSFSDYSFASPVFRPSVETVNNQDMNVTYDTIGIDLGEVIPALSSKTFTLRINMFPTKPGTYNVNGDTGMELEENDNVPTGSLMASIPKNSEVDLRGVVTRDSVVVTVINTFETSQTFSFSSNNSNFEIVNSSGNTLGNQTIGANTTQDYTIYIQRKSGITFASNSQSLNLVFIKTDANVSLGTVTALVDIDQTLLDDDAPIISNVQATFVADNGKVNLTWSATDISEIDHFIIEAYDNTDTKIKTYTTTSNSRNYTATDLTNGTYYFKVYGYDVKQNDGTVQATTCTTNEGKCSRSTSSSYTWVFTVTYNLSNGLSTTSSTEAIINTQYTGRITVSGNYSLPTSITVNMNGQNLTSGYSYSSSNGNITINNVTGNITITASGRSSGICLVKGTKVLLSDGTYKNIENITYNDLLTVWSYDSGSITYEYPIWIEKTSTTDHYQKTTLSDGTVLKTVGFHGVFSPTYNQFISVDDYDKFKVGIKVQKVENGKLKEVTITKIEQINETVNYYHVVSSRYYNIIANNILTTDGTVILSNLYGFDKNITWPKEVRNKVINDKNELYDYSEFSDIMPYYMFKALRAEEGKYLNNYGLTKDIFRYYLLNNQMNETMLLPVATNGNGNRLWMVTTNKDSNINSLDHLYEEGSYYTLPKVLGVYRWYSTSEDKYYKPLDKVKVEHSMHFIAE